MPFDKNDPNINKAGRGKGKFTSLKDDFLKVWQNGGIEKLQEFAYANNKNFLAFMQVIAKMLPRDVQVLGNEEQPLTIIISDKLLPKRKGNGKDKSNGNGGNGKNTADSDNGSES